MGKTPIEWTDFSINPIRARLGGAVGHYCEKVSPGCKNCYASRLQPRFRMPPFQEQRHEGVEPFLDASKLQEVLRRKKPTRWFWCDMSDLFGEWVPFEWIAACFGVMAATPQHTHQVLTKRPARALEFFEWLEARQVSQMGLPEETPDVARKALNGALWMNWPLPNVWLGVSAEDQQRADERIPLLLQCPAAVRFVSAEPLLGPIDFTGIDFPGLNMAPAGRFDALAGGGRGTDTPWRIDWVIVGGESGPGARPCNVQWIRSLVQQCRAAEGPVFVKQLGPRAYETLPHGATSWLRPRDRKGGDMSEWPADLRVRQFPEVRHG